MKKICFWVLIALPVMVSGQIQRDTLVAGRYLAKADSLLEAGEYEICIQLAEKAQMAFKNYKLLPGTLYANNTLADAKSRQGKYDEAQSIASQSLLLVSTSGNYLPLKAALVNTLGYIQLNKGRPDKALDHFKVALEYAQGYPLKLAECYNNIGLAYWNTGNTELATEHHQKALAIRKDKLGDLHLKTAASYNNLGLTYSSTDADKALGYYEKVLVIYKKIHKDDHHILFAYTYNNIGIIQRKKGNTNAALDNFEKVLRIYSSIYSENHPNVAFAYANIGQVFLDRKSYDKALQNLTLALTIYKNNFGEKHPEIAGILNDIGAVYAKQNNLQVALEHYQKAIIANSPSFVDKNLRANPKALDYYDANLMLTSLHLKAQTTELYHFQKSLKLKDLRLALATFDKCDTLIDHIRQSRVSKADKVALGSFASDIYENAINVSFALAEVSLNKSFYHHKAFYYNEKNKASVLLEAISDANAKAFGGIPDSLIEKEKQLRADITYYEQKLAEKPEQKLEKLYIDKLFNLNRAYESFTHRLGKDFPEYYNLKFNISIAEVPDIQKSLDKSSALLSYFIGEHTERIYIFCIENTRYQMVSVPKNENFDRQMNAMRNAIKYNSPETFNEASHLLYHQLFPVGLHSLPNHLIIIPDGKLGTLPFEAFLTKKNISSSFEYASFMLKSHIFSYNYSATLWLQSIRKSSAASGQSSAMLCAPVDFKSNYNHEGLNNLPASEAEVKNIGSLFENKKYVLQAFVGPQATESMVKSSDLAKYKYLHFATHGIVDESHPELSQIFLNPDRSHNEDGHLFSGEIFNLKIRADLVTLSACQTGLGKITKGEGIISLSRAFLYAGAQNIIVSLWTVSDASTARLMENFYTKILSSEATSYSQPLQQAKLSLAKDPVLSNPYYWAPFVLIGK